MPFCGAAGAKPQLKAKRWQTKGTHWLTGWLRFTRGESMQAMNQEIEDRICCKVQYLVPYTMCRERVRIARWVDNMLSKSWHSRFPVPCWVPCPRAAASPSPSLADPAGVSAIKNTLVFEQSELHFLTWIGLIQPNVRKRNSRKKRIILSFCLYAVLPITLLSLPQKFGDEVKHWKEKMAL